MSNIHTPQTVYFTREPVAGDLGVNQRIDVDDEAANGPEVPVMVHSVQVYETEQWNPVKRARESVLGAWVTFEYQGKLIKRPAWWKGLGL